MAVDQTASSPSSFSISATVASPPFMRFMDLRQPAIISAI
jgi:hypothetical protein